MCWTAKADRKVKLLIEFKRLRPGNRNVAADLANVTKLDVPNCAAAQQLLPRRQIAKDEQQFHGGATTVRRLESEAMKQCQSYKKRLQLQDPTLSLRCATAVHATAVENPGPSERHTSAFFVSVEPSL